MSGGESAWFNWSPEMLHLIQAVLMYGEAIFVPFGSAPKSTGSVLLAVPIP
jgi:hypothetical protein